MTNSGDAAEQIVRMSCTTENCSERVSQTKERRACFPLPKGRQALFFFNFSGILLAQDSQD